MERRHPWSALSALRASLRGSVEGQPGGDVIALVSPPVVREFGIIPIGLRDDVLVVATDDPFVTSSATEIGAIVGRRVAFALATSSGLIRLRLEHY